MGLVHRAIPIACAVALFACKEDRPAQTSTSAASVDRSPAPTSTGTSTTTMYGGASDASMGSTSTTAGAVGGPSDPTSGAVQGMPMSYEMATMRITGKRCDRMMTCNQIGADKRFSTHESCRQDQGKKTQGQLKSSDCPNGFDANKLSTCLDSIAQQDCAKLVTSLKTVDACKTTAICIADPRGATATPKRPTAPGAAKPLDPNNGSLCAKGDPLCPYID